MRFRLTTLLAATFTAALLLWANFHKREIDPVMWEDGREFKAGWYLRPGYAQGWPVTVYEERNYSSDHRVYWQPWAIALNAAFGFGLVLAVAHGVERLERKRARQKQERLKA
ncbi:MAG: hypothetical protein AMXMBFR7_18580 [Planctomycetota bacterium]